MLVKFYCSLPLEGDQNTANVNEIHPLGLSFGVRAKQSEILQIRALNETFRLSTNEGT